jgi:GT2 family glycosyltransferase
VYERPGLTISVVVPVKDRPAELERALHSVLLQRRPADEVIVVDDGSAVQPDLSWWPEEGPLLTVIRNDTSMGSGGARNEGVRAAHCDWVAFLDSDDEWLPVHLECVAAASPGMVAVVTGYRASYHDGASHHDVLPNIARDTHRRLLRLQHHPVSCTTTAVSLEWFEKVSGFRQETAPLEDYDLLLRLAGCGAVASVRTVTAIKDSGRKDRVYSVARDAAVLPVLMRLHEEALANDRVAARRFVLRERLRTHQAGAAPQTRRLWKFVMRARLDVPRRLASLLDRRR